MPLHLSPELLAIIISFIPKSCLPLLSTVSRTWQAAIERHTMSAIHLKSTDLQDFASVFSQGHRRLALAQLHYDVILPSYSDHQSARFETDRDKRLNNEVLTAAIHELFSLLYSWEHEAPPAAAVGIQTSHGPPTTTTTTTRGKQGARARPFTFNLNVYSLSDAFYREGVDLHEQRRDAEMTGGRKDLFEHRYEHSFLRLLRADELPPISRISTFENAVDLCFERRIEGATLAGISAKMPNLERVVWFINDDERKFPEVRRIHRFQFAQSLSTPPLHNLRSLTLHLYNKRPWNQSFILPNALLLSSPRTDHLSLALHQLSQSPNLAHLMLSGEIVLSPSIFWPSSAQEDEEWVSMNKNDNNCSSISNNPASLNTSPSTPSPTPFWPHLRELYIALSVNTPTGGWLYNPDPLSTLTNDQLSPGPFSNLPPSPSSTYSSDSDNSSIPDEYDHELEARIIGDAPYSVYRTMADSKKIDEWMLAMGKAVGHMPALEDLRWEADNHCLCGIVVKFLAGEKKWLVVVGTEARWEVSGKLRRVMEDVGVGVTVQCKSIDPLSFPDN